MKNNEELKWDMKKRVHFIGGSKDGNCVVDIWLKKLWCVDGSYDVGANEATFTPYPKYEE